MNKNIMNCKFVCWLTVILAFNGTVNAASDISRTFHSGKPNILMILVDDLGYTDLGSYGGNIDTANMDQLAAQGMRFSNAHAYPSCAPSRASLLTGQDPHKVGLGGQNGVTPVGVSPKASGYSSSLEGEFTSIAALVKKQGYRTYQSGKWHLGHEEHQLPAAMGFEKYFTLIDAAASHYDDNLAVSQRVSPTGRGSYIRNGEIVSELPEDFYSTKNFTDEIINMIEAGKDDDRPFFAYLAYTAVHDPLHAPDEYIDKYRDAFSSGFEELRQERVRGLARSGLISDDPVATEKLKEIPYWKELTSKQKEDLSKRMAVYAAMLDYMDEQIGRLVKHLKEIGEFDNTLIVIASDNGAAGTPMTVYTEGNPDDIVWQKANYPLRSIDDYGRKGSFPTMGLPNAQASSGPYHNVKLSLHEGGTRIPLIVKVPNKNSSGIINTFFHLSDLYPTFADYAGADTNDQNTLLGVSFYPILENSDISVPDRGFGMEYMGLRSYRKGDWKLVFVPEAIGGTGDYALYNLASDPGETRDLGRDHPAIVEDLAIAWFDYASENGVIVVPMSLVNEHYNRIGSYFLGIDWAE